MREGKSVSGPGATPAETVAGPRMPMSVHYLDALSEQCAGPLVPSTVIGAFSIITKRTQQNPGSNPSPSPVSPRVCFPRRRSP